MSLPIHEIKEKRLKRRKLVEEAGALINENRDNFTDEIREQVYALHREADLLEIEIEQAEAELRAEQDAEDRTARRADLTGSDRQSVDEAEAEETEYRAALLQYMIMGREMPESARSVLQARSQKAREEFRQMATDPGAVGGYLIPEGFVYEIEQARKQFGGMMQAAREFPTASGNDLPWPTSDDTSNEGEIVGENALHPDQEVAVGQVMIKSAMFSSKIVKVSLQLMQDSAFNMDTFLGPLLGERIGRRENRAYTNGDGTNTGAGGPEYGPLGMITEATLGPTLAASNAITYQEIVDLEHSVDPAYRIGARFMFHDDVLKALKLLMDGQGRPLWLPSVEVGEPSTFLGYPYTVNQDMDTFAVNAKLMAFGNMQKYVIRNITGYVLRRLDERYAELGQVAFLAFKRGDGRLIDAGTNPVKYAQAAAI